MRALKHIIIWVLVLALLVGTVWYFVSYNPALTAKMLSHWGAGRANSGDYTSAIRLYKWAYGLQPQDQQLAIQLADVYKSSGNYTKAEYTLSGAIAAGGDADVYLELCRTYVEQDKLLDAVTMLDQVADPAIREDLNSRRPAAPTVDQEPGFYNQYITVNVSGEGGKLCVSESKEYPSTQSENETAVTLGQGETTISAVCVTEDGLVSPLSVFGYTVGGVVEPVTLADAALDAYVRELLSKSSDSELTTADLWSITELVVPEEVADFSQLHYFSGLTSLAITGRSSLDIGFLEKMTNLTTLNLSGCTFDAEQLSLIGALTSLQKLNLSNCQLSTITGLTGTTTLVSLDLSVNSISDLSPIMGNTSLETLNLQHNAISTVSAIANMTALNWLDISNNSLADLSPIGGCSAITHLDVSNNALTALSGISGLENLTWLDASYNALTDMTGISSCVNLTDLDLSNNALENMDETVSLVNLANLDLSYNNIKTIPDFPNDTALATFNGCHNFFEDVSGLSGLEKLNYVYLDYNNITDINVLSSCKNLIQVNVFRTNVSDISGFSGMDVIISYNPT